MPQPDLLVFKAHEKLDQQGNLTDAATLVQRVAVRDRSPGDKLATATPVEKRFWTSSPTLVPGPLAREKAAAIVGELREPRAKARAIYD